MSEFHQLILTLISFATLLIGYFGVREKMKDRKEKRFWKRKEEADKVNDLKNKMMLIEFNEDIKKDLKLLLKNYTTIVKNDEDNKKIKEELCQIKKEIELHNRHFNEYQKQSLAAEIVRFADNLKRGHEKGRNSFKHIAECYNKYKELGGNHYIDEEWTYIKKVMKDESN